MKKAITSFMIIFVLLIGSTISVKAAYAPPVIPLPASSAFEGTGYRYEPNQGYNTVNEEVSSIYAVTDTDSNVILDITLLDGTIMQFVLYLQYDEWDEAYYYDSDGTDWGYFYLDNGNYIMAFYSNFEYIGKLTMVSTADFTGTKVIGTTTTSAAGEYMVVVGGSISGTYPGGRHEVTDVENQPLTIMGVNLTNGTVVILDTSSIDSMYVTVIGGQITKVEIEGHLQTSPGNFDTYSIVI